MAGGYGGGQTGGVMTAQRWRMVLWAAMLLLVAYVAWRARAALLPFAVGALLAYTLTPVVDLVARVLPARGFRLLTPRAHQVEVLKRGIAVLLVYLAIGAGLVGIGAVLIPVAVDQVVQFVDTLPEIVDNAREQSADWLRLYRERVPEDVQARIDVYAEDAGDALAETVAGMARGSAGALTDTVGVIFGFLIVPFWMFYALRDRHNVGRNFMNAVPSPLRDDVANLLGIADSLLFRYVRGQLLLGVVVGVAVGIGLTVMDVPLSLALGLFAGITELIPIIGPFLGAVPALVIVAGTNPDQILWVGLLYLVVQQLENNLLVPRIQGHATDLHPAIVILLLVLAGAGFGFMGLLVIVPLAAILRELFWYSDRRLRSVTPADAFALTSAASARASGRPWVLRAVDRLRGIAERESAIAEQQSDEREPVARRRLAAGRGRLGRGHRPHQHERRSDRLRAALGGDGDADACHLQRGRGPHHQLDGAVREPVREEGAGGHGLLAVVQPDLVHLAQRQRRQRVHGEPARADIAAPDEVTCRPVAGRGRLQHRGERVRRRCHGERELEVAGRRLQLQPQHLRAERVVIERHDRLDALGVELDDRGQSGVLPAQAAEVLLQIHAPAHHQHERRRRRRPRQQRARADARPR